MDIYQGLIIAQTVLGILGMSIWYKIGFLKGRNHGIVPVDSVVEVAEENN